MRDYDPWIFEMLGGIEHRNALGRPAALRLARQAAEWQAARASISTEGPGWSSLGRLLGGLTGGARLRLRGSTAKAS